MCLILVSNPTKGDFKFILASNRDEFYERKTNNMFWWSDIDGLLAGQDLEQKGTWLGISKKGKFAAVTNVREFYKDEPHEKFLSRGDLVKDFFNFPGSPKNYVKDIEAEKYMGFNLIVSNFESSSVFSSQGIENFNSELIVIGNRALNTETEKLKSAEKDFQAIITDNFNHSDLISLMQSPKKNYELDLKQIRNNHGNEFNSRFITSDIYGTRSTTVITIDRENQVNVSEVVYDGLGKNSESNFFNFKIQS